MTTGGQVHIWPGHRGFLRIYLVLSVNWGEKIRKSTEGLRFSEQEEALGPEGIMKEWNDSFLQERPEVNQHVPATDEIQPGKGGIPGEILLGKNAELTNGFTDLVARIDLDKETPEPLGRHVNVDVLGIHASTGLLDGQVADVCAKNLDRDVACRISQELKQADGNGVSFLARRDPRHPHPYVFLRGSAFCDDGEYLVF
jgi:hypothetical protein